MWIFVLNRKIVSKIIFIKKNLIFLSLDALFSSVVNRTIYSTDNSEQGIFMIGNE